MPSSSVTVSSPPRCSRNSASPSSSARPFVGAAEPERVVPERKPERSSRPRMRSRCRRVQQADLGRVAACRAPCRSPPPRRGAARWSVSDLELVRGPVAEVERPRAAELERIARRRDVLEVELARSARTSSLTSVEVAGRERRRVRLEPVEERRVADRAPPSPPRPCRRRGRARGSVARKSRSFTTANGGANVPRKFFAPNALMPFLTPTPESFCAEHRRRQAHDAHAAMGRRRGVADHVEHGAAADDHDDALAIDAERVEPGLQIDERGRVVLHGLAARRRRPASPPARGARAWAST